MKLPRFDKPDPRWMEAGACRGGDTERFYPSRGQDPKPAKSVCRSCPVIEVCLEYALVRPERFGVWGGLSERERRRLKARRSLVAS